MNNASLRLISLVTSALALVFLATPALALDQSPFTVHGYDLGEKIELESGRKVWTAEFDVSLDGVADHIASFCVDLDTYLGVGSYDVREVIDAFNAPSYTPTGEATRNFAWAGHVMDNFGFDVDLLVNEGVSRAQAITGVQAAIWEGIYGGGIVKIDSLSAGARSVYEMIVAPGQQSFLAGIDGPAMVVEMVGKQDQVVSAPVPEPSAALVFGLGSVIAGSAVRRR